jgi:hypothetical protein
MYTVTNYPTKKALQLALATGKKERVFQPNAMFPVNTENGTVYLEGPHFPKPHTWYAKAVLKDGYIIKII